MRRLTCPFDGGGAKPWPVTGARASSASSAGSSVQSADRPDVELLDLPARRYDLWTGPLRSATAFRHQPQDPPSLIWPQDRSWPICANEVAVAGTRVLINAILTDQQLNAHPATPNDVLDIDD